MVELTEEQFREIIGRVVRDSDFADDLKNAASGSAFRAALSGAGYEVSEEQAARINDNFQTLQAAAVNLCMSDVRGIIS